MAIGDFNGDGKLDLAVAISNSDTVSVLLQSSLSARDHKTDANGDGYSAADEATIANCGVVSCASVITLGTAETRTCNDAGRNCGSPVVPTDESVPAPRGAAASGRLRLLDHT